DQMADRHGGFFRVGAAVADDDRCRRLLFLAAEIGALGHDDVNARRLDAGNRLDGAGNLAFKRAYAGDLLHEGGEAQRTDIVEEFVAGVGAGRQALFGEQHARLRRRAGRYQNGGSVRAYVEGDAGFAEHHADLVHVRAFEADIEGLVGGTVEIDRAEADHGDHDCRDAGQNGKPPGAETLEVRDECLDLFRHGSTAPASLPETTLDREACAKMKSGRAFRRGPIS